MKKLILTCTLFLSAFISLKATHNIAGEITYTCVGGNTYEILVTTYTNTGSIADRWEMQVFFGDGYDGIADRVNGPLVGPNGETGPDGNEGYGVMLGSNYPNTKVNQYRITHTYNPAMYTIHIMDPNRIGGIENIPNSINVPFYLKTDIVVDPFIGCHNSPQLTTIPLDKACVGSCFYHNPGAYDIDGDSLAYKIGPCLDENGVPIAGYEYPNDPSMGGGNLTIDAVTGDLAWCSPMASGKYNLVIYIEEWRRQINGNRVLIGTVLRDMSIDVLDQCNNENPEIPELPDLCVDAGTLVNFSFVTTDPDMDSVRMEAYGGMFNVTPAATITPNNTLLPTPLNTNFNWQTNCERVRLQPWTVTFKATDDGGPNGIGVVLVDIESVNITVVSPGPATLSATPQGSAINLAWGVSPCDPVSNPGVGYKIYRKQGLSFWNPSQCETGVPATTGFVLIAVVNGLANTTFTDNNGGAGLIPGIDYCYRVHTYFLDGAESYASPEACTELLRDVPVITNVDITSTSTVGILDVKWVNPLANGIDFDTTIHPGPYILNIQRTDNSFVTSASPTLIATFTVQNFYQLPTLFQDAGINTQDNPFTYRIDFSAANGTDVIGSSQSASSVLLATTPSDNQLLLTWQEITPWNNSSYDIFRFNTVTSLWDSIGNSPVRSYVDDSLVNGTEYCYYVRSRGSYSNALLPSPLLNRSQEKCGTPADLTPPCAPVLAIHSDCFIGLNQLIWSNPNNMNCGTDDVVSYQIWYTPIENGAMQIIATVILSGDTIINFSNLMSVAGCYSVTAQDTFGNQSPFSNLVCVDNCPDYTLPNVFTPNADGTNDYFVPFPYHYVESISIQIFDRWGVMVFETNDPDIFWNGRDMKSGKVCTDGVYYYTCIVNEIRLQGIVPRKISGFFHLFGTDAQPE